MRPSQLVLFGPLCSSVCFSVCGSLFFSSFLAYTKSVRDTMELSQNWDFRQRIRDGPKTASESTLSNAELSELLALAKRAPLLCAKGTSPSFPQNSPSLPQKEKQHTLEDRYDCTTRKMHDGNEWRKVPSSPYLVRTPCIPLCSKAWPPGNKEGFRFQVPGGITSRGVREKLHRVFTRSNPASINIIPSGRIQCLE